MLPFEPPEPPQPAPVNSLAPQQIPGFIWLILDVKKSKGFASKVAQKMKSWLKKFRPTDSAQYPVVTVDPVPEGKRFC